MNNNNNNDDFYNNFFNNNNQQQNSNYYNNNYNMNNQQNTYNNYNNGNNNSNNYYNNNSYYNNNGYNNYDVPKKFYEQTWFIILCLIFLFPIGLIFLCINKHIQKQTKIIISVIIIGLFTAMMIIGGTMGTDNTVTSNTTSTQKVEQSIKTFLTNHKEVQISEITSIKQIENWNNGERYSVTTKDNKTYLFYFDKNDIVGVWDVADRDKPLFHVNTTHVDNTIVERKEESNLPKYTIISKVKISGTNNIMADIIISDYSRQTNPNTLKDTCDKIAEKEGFNIIYLYSNEEAQKSNYSESYLKEHPNAKQGFLGSWEDGKYETPMN